MKNAILTIAKDFKDIPFAHRQPNHNGHCRQIHGHNWSLRVEFQAATLDENGFVIDFGKLGFLKDWLNLNFDHACVLNADDPLVNSSEIKSLIDQGMLKLKTVPNGSCEGLAEYFFVMLGTLVGRETGQRVTVRSVIVFEDEKNSAFYGIK
jgi:6-pyruvoyltetrahydropterin/6-carboxytetrahydropterin synthase